MILRYEFKYRLTEEKAQRVMAAVDPHMTLDKHTPPGAENYLIRSLYFDTPTLECYDSKLAGVWGRIKVRLRRYGTDNNPGDVVFLELKHKRGGLGYKSRLVLPAEAPTELDGEGLLRWLRFNWRPDDSASHRNIWRTLCYPGLRPTVLVSYRRRAYTEPGPRRLRITFDSQISGRNTDVLHPHRNGFGLRPAVGGFVMEIKFTQCMPNWMQHIIHGMDLQPQAVSKYTHVMDTVAPLFESRRGHALIDEGLTWPATAFLYHAPRRRT